MLFKIILASFVYDVILEGSAYWLENTWFSKTYKTWNEPLALTLNLRCFNDTALKNTCFF